MLGNSLLDITQHFYSNLIMKYFILLLCLQTGGNVIAQKSSFSNKNSFNIAIGYADILNPNAYWNYGSFVFSNEYTRHYDQFNFNCRVSFLTSTNFSPIKTADTLSVEKWRGYATQSIDLPVNYGISNKKISAGIGIGPTFRHRMSVIPGFNANNLENVQYQHTVDYGYIIQTSFFIKIKKQIYWHPYVYYTAYNAGRPVLGMNMGFGYVF
jgi:hypothetical protein